MEGYGGSNQNGLWKVFPLSFGCLTVILLDVLFISLYLFIYFYVYLYIF